MIVLWVKRLGAAILRPIKNPAGGSQQGLVLSISEEANMGDFTIDGTDRQIKPHDVAWLQLRLDRGRREKFAEFGLLTPSLAKLLLSINGSNRPIRETRAEQYAKDILAGRWETNGEAVAISSCGNLNEGQHRCTAVIIANKPIEVVFSFGVSYESRLTTNTGAPKTAGDFLGMDGVKNANNLAAIASGVIDYEGFGKLSTTAVSKPTKSEVRERVMCDDGIERSFLAVRKKGAGRIASNSILGMAHYIFSEVDADAADEFFDKLISGAELKQRDPIHVAREKLIDPYKRLNKNEQLKCIFMAWNNWRAGKTVRTLTHTIKKGEKLPEVR